MPRSTVVEFIHSLQQDLSLLIPNDDMGADSMDLYQYLEALHTFYLALPNRMLQKIPEARDEVLQLVAVLDTAMRRQNPPCVGRIVNPHKGLHLLSRALVLTRSSQGRG